jgi:small subunit ribosomal protein S16
MVKIRLKRTGKKKQPSYRVVVADARSPRDGRIIENIGWYNPLVEPSAIHIKEDRALNWLQNGAQPTDSVTSLLKRAGILERFESIKGQKATQNSEEGLNAVPQRSSDGIGIVPQA